MPSALDPTYTGSAQALVSAGTAPDECTIYYRTETSSWSTKVPTATNAGNYKVYYKIDGGAKYQDVGETLVNCEIKKATPTLSLSSTRTIFNPPNMSATITITNTSDGALTLSSSDAAVATATLSGDKKSRVDMVASALYADGAYSQLLPEHKLDALEDIIENTKNAAIGYCGDGINDLPSLSRADVGISMGSLGSDSAIEKSDVVITDDDIEKISKAYDIAKRTKRTVIGNIIFAISIKALVAVLDILIPAFPMFLAVLADVGVILVTILIALGAGKSSKH
jgi:soluble P-type ATPase